MRRVFLFAVLVFTILISCASFPRPDDSQNPLIIGNVVLHATGFKMYGSTSVNGEHTLGIVITVYNIQTTKTYLIKSGKNGFFYSNLLPAGKYKIAKLFYEKKIGSSWSNVWSEPGNESKYFIVTNDVVNNVGFISWSAVKDMRSRFVMNAKYDETAASFKELDKDGTWGNIDIVQVPFTQTL